MEVKYKAFSEFKFEENEAWKGYLKTIYPEPNRVQLSRLKKKWYKREIDKDFDIDFVSATITTDKGKESKTVGNSPGSQNKKQGPIISIVGNIQMLLFSIFFFAFPWMYIKKGFYSFYALIAALLIGVISRHKIPKCNKMWWVSTFMDEDLHHIALAFLSYLTWGWILPLWIPTLIICFVFLSSGLYIASKTTSCLKCFGSSCIKKIVDNKDKIIELGSDLEIYMGFYLIICIIFNWLNFMVFLLYWQMMFIRYNLVDSTKAAFERMGQALDNTANSNYCPRFLGYLLRKFHEMGTGIGNINLGTDPSASQDQSSGPSCITF